MSHYSRLNEAPTLQQIAELVREFKKKVQKLKECSLQLGSSRNPKQVRSQITRETDDAKALSKQIVDAFKASKPARKDKILHDKLTKEFETVMKQFNDVSVQIINKEKEIAAIVNEVRNDEEFKRTGNASHMDDHKRRQTTLLQEIGEFDELVLQERDQTIRQLEKDLTEVNHLFKDVAHLVEEQGEMLNEAEGHTDVAVAETSKAVVELHKADHYQRKSKKKLIIICVCAVVLCVVVAVPIIMTQL